MALPINKKDLSYSSFEEFRQKTCFDFSKLDFNRPSICNSLLKLYDQGTLCLSTGEDEKAYMLLFRFFEGYLRLKNSKLYKQDRNYVENFISKEKLSKSMNILESLNEEIKQRYEQRDQSQKRTVEIDSKADELLIESKNWSISSSINPTELTSLIKQNIYSILLIDTRPQSEYEQCHINLDYLISSEKNQVTLINIADNLIDTTSWKICDALNKNHLSNTAEIFSQRKNFDYLILFDSNSFYKDLKSDSKLSILKRAVYDFDLDKVKCEPVILDGGWSQWLLYYPAYKTLLKTTNSTTSQISQMVDQEEKKMIIDYPEVASEVDQPEANDESEQMSEESEINNLLLKPVIDRSNKPKDKENKEARSNEPFAAFSRSEKPKLANTENSLSKNESLNNTETIPSSTLKNFLPNINLNRLEKPELSKANMMNSNPINETIFNSVYAPIRFKYVHTPFMKEGDNKVLNPVTGTFSYENKPEGFNTEAKLKDIKNVPKENKPNLKRTVSSPNIADLDNAIDEKNLLSSRTLEKPMVNRSNKPLKENMLVLRFEDFEPVYAKVHPGLTGIRNLGNTCYMNSVIQCLSNTESFVKYFLSGQFRKDINRKNSLGFKGEVADEFAVILNVLWTGRCRIISTLKFKYLIEEFNQLFVSNEQQDAQEFLLFLLDGLHEDLNRVKRRPKICSEENSSSDSESAEKAWKDHLTINNSIIVDLFQGQFRSTVACTTCGKKSVKFDAFMYLTLPIYTTKCNLHECLDLFLRSENMSGESKWKCPNCKQYRDATKKIDIWKLPPLLIIHLKRFKYEGVWRDKINSYVDFPIENLDFSKFLSGPNHEGLSNKYRLYGVTNHIGTMDGGHYTSMCRHFEMGRWIKYDDTDVKEMTNLSALKSPASYILFYSRY